jgi:hypothetical protein
MVTARMEGKRKEGRPGKMWTTRLQEFEYNGNNRLTCIGQVSEGIEKDRTGSQGPKWNVALEKEEKNNKKKNKIQLLSQSVPRVHIQRPSFSKINVRLTSFNTRRAKT